MAILQIGRAFDGLDVDAATARWSGSQLSVAGDLFLGAVTAANRPGTAAAVRDRLLALAASEDERAVPVVWSEDASLNGWYRVTGASVDYDPASLTDGHISWAADLQLVTGTAQHEVIGSYGLLANDQGITSLDIQGPILGIPGSSTDMFSSLVGVATRKTPTSRTTSDGTCDILYNSSATSWTAAKASATYTVAVDKHYEAACSIRGTYAGIADTLVLGRDMEPLAGSGLKISNETVRCGFAAGGAITVECYDAGTWRTVGPATWGLTAAYLPGGAVQWTNSVSTSSGIQILRNSPECVSVRLYNIAGATQNGRFWLDVTVKRGSRIVEFLATFDTVLNAKVAPSSNTASTAINGGLRATSNDANGNRHVLVGSRGTQVVGATGASYAWQTNTTTGAIEQGAVSGSDGWYTAPFGIGVELDGSSATGINTAANVALEYFAGRTETQRVVQR